MAETEQQRAEMVAVACHLLNLTGTARQLFHDGALRLGEGLGLLALVERLEREGGTVPPGYRELIEGYVGMALEPVGPGLLRRSAEIVAHHISRAKGAAS